ncbi:DNA repair ATPase, partial [Streptomyces sp. NPDC059909]|uniref:DNA repair ATPase n=1 Tax=Streptomyces sp. NPDC059909 TaxID=3346998 RepID=UPI0036698093
METETRLPARCERFYRRERRSVPAARDFTAAVLDDWDARVPRDDVLLCVSELATNALLHGVPPGRGFRLFVLRADDGGEPTRVHPVQLWRTPYVADTRADAYGGDGPLARVGNPDLVRALGACLSLARTARGAT